MPEDAFGDDHDARRRHTVSARLTPDPVRPSRRRRPAARRPRGVRQRQRPAESARVHRHIGSGDRRRARPRRSGRSGALPRHRPAPPPASATPASDPILAPSAPAVSVTAVSGALKLAWTASTDASSYRVQKQLDGGSWLDDGPSLDPTTFAADRSVPVAQWARTRFRVQACNTAGCTTSADMQAAASMAATLRYLKASNTGAGDLFGGSVALSADGNTLAVGAFDEDSAETGTAGTGADNSAPDSGAVYVF